MEIRNFMVGFLDYQIRGLKMKNLLESFAILLVVILSAGIIYLIVEYNMIDEKNLVEPVNESEYSIEDVSDDFDDELDDDFDEELDEDFDEELDDDLDE